MPVDNLKIHDIQQSLSSSDDFNKCFEHVNDPQLSFSLKEFYSEKEEFIGDSHFHQKPQQPDRVINKTLYISQREAAILLNQRSSHDPIQAVGSDDATTCQILFLRTTHATSVVHLDGGNQVAEKFLERSIASFRRLSAQSNSISAPLEVEVYLVGGFDDSRGLSRQVLSEILSLLHDTPDVLFSVRLLAVGPLNSSTQRPAFLTKNHLSSSSTEPLQYPIAYGATIDLCTGHVRRTRFALEARAPDAVLRLTAINCDPVLRFVYDEVNGGSHIRFSVEPFTSDLPEDYIRAHILGLAERSPARFLHTHSTSPHAEPDHFISLVLDSYQLLIPDSDSDSEDDSAARFTRKFFSGLDPSAPSATPLARHYQLSPEGCWIRVQ